MKHFPGAFLIFFIGAILVNPVQAQTNFPFCDKSIQGPPAGCVGTFSGMAMIRLDSGQTWYNAAAISVMINQNGEYYWSGAFTPESDFWGRNIDLILDSFETDKIRDIESGSEADGTLWVKVPQWGKITITPERFDIRRTLSDLRLRYTAHQRVKIILWPNGEIIFGTAPQ